MGGHGAAGSYGIALQLVIVNLTAATTASAILDFLSPFAIAPMALGVWIIFSGVKTGSAAVWTLILDWPATSMAYVAETRLRLVEGFLMHSDSL